MNALHPGTELGTELGKAPELNQSQGLRDFLRSDAAAGRLRALRTPSIPQFLLAVLFDYSVIALAICVSELSGSWFLWLPAIVIIAARQHALLVLMHEGAHRSVSRNRNLNDLLSDLLCGAPLLISTRSYRKAHLTHHQHLNTEHDPDWCRKVDNPTDRDQWLFPSTLPLWRLLGNLYSHSVLYLLKTLSDNQRTEPTDSVSPSQTSRSSNNPATEQVTEQVTERSPGAKPANVLSDATLANLKYVLYAIAGVALTLTSTWSGLVLYWLAPMFLVLPLIMRIRSIAEHFALRHDHPLRQTRTVRAGRLERLLIAPHYIGLHIDHHLAASVPFYQLPRLHSLLLECSDYRANAHLNDGYFIRRSTRDQPSRGLFSADLYGSPSVALQSSATPQDNAVKTATS